MLLDEWNVKHHDRVPAVQKALVKAKPRAMRFQFSDEVITTIAHLIKEYPDLLLRNYQFALPRYECMYVEYNIDTFIKALGTVSTADKLMMALYQNQRDIHVGYLIDGNAVYCLVDGRGFDGRQGSICGPLVYTINHDHSPPPGIVPFPMRIDDDTWLAWLMGSTLSNDKAHWDNEKADDICRRFRVWSDKGLVHAEKELVEVMMGSQGEIRNLMVMLLWLNQPANLDLDKVAARRAWFGKREIAYAAHHVVKMKPGMTLRSMLRSFVERRSPRRHQVGEFFRNFDKTTGCEHDWPIFPNEDGRWQCRKCPQWRIRVKEHSRGDAGIGYVTKEYKI